MTFRRPRATWAFATLALLGALVAAGLLASPSPREDVPTEPVAPNPVPLPPASTAAQPPAESPPATVPQRDTGEPHPLEETPSDHEAFSQYWMDQAMELQELGDELVRLGADPDQVYPMIEAHHDEVVDRIEQLEAKR